MSFSMMDLVVSLSELAVQGRKSTPPVDTPLKGYGTLFTFTTQRIISR